MRERSGTIAQEVKTDTTFKTLHRIASNKLQSGTIIQQKVVLLLTQVEVSTPLPIINTII
jgi:hypothetical protein